MAVRIQLRNDTAANWTDADPVLAAGEFGLETDTEQFKVGDGTSTWEELPYGGIVGPQGDEGNQGIQGPPGELVNLVAESPLSYNDSTSTLSFDGTDYATIAYVDNVATGIISKPAVRAATTTNLSAIYDNGVAGVGATLTADTNRAFTTLDGVTVWSITSPPMGVLVKNQTNKAHNGRYNLTTLGSGSAPWVLTKCGLCDEANEIPGSYIFVQNGTANNGTGWVLSVNDALTFEVGEDDVNVFQFSGPGTITAGTNVSVSGNEVSIVNNPTFSGTVTTNNGILNAQSKNALIASGYNSASGGFAQASRVVITATATGSTAPTTRPDGTALVAGDVWISF